MTHLNPSGAAHVRPATISTQLTTARPAGAATPLRLDRDRLTGGVLARRRRLAAVEADMVAACERAAVHGATREVLIDDRETWDHATWNRYLAAAARLEPDYGPHLRRLYHEIDQLSRLIELPLAA